jgi:adenosylcobinamide kinase/adenosylcobinamide-phosphate guanylyltransferase
LATDTRARSQIRTVIEPKHGVQPPPNQLDLIRLPVSRGRAAREPAVHAPQTGTPMPELTQHRSPPRLTLVLGGARSGKSRYAERRVLGSGLAPVYVATAQALDDEMAARIERHRARRGVSWRTIEEPCDLSGALLRECAPGRAVLVDCLTLWLTNLMVAERPVRRQMARLVELLPSLPGDLILVSNEVGLGVVPTDAMARAFVDHAGWLHQRIAQQAQDVVFMAAGLPLHLKPPSDR